MSSQKYDAQIWIFYYFHNICKSFCISHIKNTFKTLHPTLNHSPLNFTSHRNHMTYCTVSKNTQKISHLLSHQNPDFLANKTSEYSLQFIQRQHIKACDRLFNFLYAKIECHWLEMAISSLDEKFENFFLYFCMKFFWFPCRGFQYVHEMILIFSSTASVTIF